MSDRHFRRVPVAPAHPRTLSDQAVTGAVLVARSYLRVSEDRAKLERSTTEQDVENTRAISALGWVQAEPYRDNDRSASEYGTKVRDDFWRLIEDLEEGRFGADVLVLWESSRGSRQMWEWVLLMDLLKAAGVLVHVTTHHRTYDPRNWRDRRTLLEDGVDNEAESAKVSIRTSRTAASEAAAGRPTGKCPVGYRRVYDPNTGKMTTQVPDPELAPWIRDLFERIAQGHAFLAIARDWEAAGIRNGKGQPYTGNHLRAMARTHAYTGLRVHIPGRPKSGWRKLLGPENLIEANWEAIVPRDLFWQVQEILDDPRRRTTRPGRANHLLSQIARCGRCQGPLVWRDHLPQGGVREASYVCKNGHVRVLEAALDDLAEDALLGYLASEQLAEDLAASEADGQALREARAEVHTLRARRAGIADQLAEGLDPRIAQASIAKIDRALVVAEKRERDLATPEDLRGLIEPGPGVEDRWKATPALAVRRQIARLVFAPDALGTLYVLPTQHRGPVRVPIEERVRIGEEE